MMAKKKNINASEIISKYMDYVLEHNEQPKSVHSFSKHHNFEEQKFYEHFGNFEALEQSVFKAFFDNTHQILERSQDYMAFDSRNKLLSFYYTFFENLTANRSYVVYTLHNHKNSLNKVRMLAKLKQRFTTYIKHLGIETLDVKHEKLEKIQNRTLEETAWLQLLIIMKFWLDDTSASFEKTDIFIEKAVNTTFDLIDVQPLKSIIDLGKFLFKEKIQMN